MGPNLEKLPINASNCFFKIFESYIILKTLKILKTRKI